MHWLRNTEDAEDAVQDALLSAFKHIAQFEGRAQMSTWLNAIVTNAARMKLRRRPRCQMMSLDQVPEKCDCTISEMLADPRPTPERTAEQCQLSELVTELIGSLPRSQRAALRLRQRHDFSVREAAEALGVPVGTLKAQIARGRAKLIERLHKATRIRTRISDTDSKSRRRPRSRAAAYSSGLTGTGSDFLTMRIQIVSGGESSVTSSGSGRSSWKQTLGGSLI
jgi:RNA polymerase sigma-70 factor (ECF subfamily)